MVRFQIRLTEQQLTELRKRSSLEGVSIAQLIRQSINEQLRVHADSSRLQHLERLANESQGSLRDLLISVPLTTVPTHSAAIAMFVDASV